LKNKKNKKENEFSLKELTSICNSIPNYSDRLPEHSSSFVEHALRTNNPSTSIPLYVKSTKKEKRDVYPSSENKRPGKKILPTIRTEFVSPTWSKILNEELRLRASRNESHASNYQIQEKSRSADSVVDPISNADTHSTSATPETCTVSITNNVRPSYTRDTDRITRYDTEIAAIFDGNSEKNDDDDGFDLVNVYNSTSCEHPVASRANQAPSFTGVVDTVIGSNKEYTSTTSVTNGSKIRNKFLQITSEARSMSRSPSGSKKFAVESL